MFSKDILLLALFQGLGLLAVTLAAFLIGLYRGMEEMDARAITFTTLIVGNITLIWSDRSRTRNILGVLRSRNKPLWAVTGGAMLLLILVLYTPGLRTLFKLAPLHPNDLAVCFLLGVSSLMAFEIAKLAVRRKTV